VTEHDDFVRVGDVAAWKRGRGRRVVVDGVAIAVFRDGDRWIALDDTCPHMGASLADGRLFGGELQCSWHEWRYDVATGRCPVRPWARVDVHEIQLRDAGVWIRLRRSVPGADGATPADTDDPEWMRWNPDRYFK
jgi:nitrite reductase (NADH) small subunit/3-phenylpropionate/trans-cinnamate dioxygenase ferredoxin subunit